MSSLFSALKRYQDRPGRTRSEDFLTEALVAVLRRLPHVLALSFIRDILFHDTAEKTFQDWFARIDRQPLHWRTQVRHTDGTDIPDIILEVDRQIVLIVEAKINAPFAGHLPPGNQLPATPPPPDNESKAQLHRYGRLLARQSQPGALAIITHFTDPPDDYFQEGHGDYGIALRAACRWRHVSAWLCEITRDVDLAPWAERLAWQDLAWELSLYLEGERMAGGELQRNLVETAQEGLDATSPLNSALISLSESLKPQLKNLGFGNPKGSGEFNFPGRVIWNWAYLRQSGRYVAWGIRFAGSEWWTKAEPPLTDQASLFIVLDTDGDRIPKEVLTQPIADGWSLAEKKGSFSTIKNIGLDSLTARQGNRSTLTEPAADWLKEKISELASPIKLLSSDA